MGTEALTSNSLNKDVLNMVKWHDDCIKGRLAKIAVILQKIQELQKVNATEGVTELRSTIESLQLQNSSDEKMKLAFQSLLRRPLGLISHL